jgi:hypothetical protein
MTRLGLTRVNDILDGHTISLPTNLTVVGDSCRGVLTQTASQLGYDVRWVDEESRARELHVPYQIHPGDCGPTLIVGRVRSIVRTTTHEGVIVAYDTSTEVYTIRFQDFTTELWTLQHVQQHLLPDNLNDTWTEEDRATLRSRILGVWVQTNRTTTQETPLITCEFDFSVLKSTTTRCPYNQDHVSVTCRKGQAHIIEATVTSTTVQTGRRHPRGVNTKRSRPLTKTNNVPLDESRWDLLQLETSRENLIQHWIQSWQALTTWEKNGDRTIHWSISTTLNRHFNLDVIIGGWNLTEDPSYPFFHPVGCPIPAGTRALVPLYQYIEADTPTSWFNNPESMWVVMVYST